MLPGIAGNPDMQPQFEVNIVNVRDLFVRHVHIRAPVNIWDLPMTKPFPGFFTMDDLQVEDEYLKRHQSLTKHT
jgi:hypothetical protein